MKTPSKSRKLPNDLKVMFFWIAAVKPDFALDVACGCLGGGASAVHSKTAKARLPSGQRASASIHCGPVCSAGTCRRRPARTSAIGPL